MTEEASRTQDWLTMYLGHVVVVDLAAEWLVIGRLETVGPDHLAFADADLHDHREANSTREQYTLESARLGVRINRRRVAIPRQQLIAISRLEDTILGG